MNEVCGVIESLLHWKICCFEVSGIVAIEADGFFTVIVWVMCECCGLDVAGEC